MKGNVLEGVELRFKDLTEETQKRLYLRDWERFEEEAAKSQYDSIRQLVIENEESKSSSLDEIFMVEIQTDERGTVTRFAIARLNLIWNHVNFQKSDEKRNMLLKSNIEEIKIIVAEDPESSSDLLNQIVLDEVKNDGFQSVVEAATNNPNFKMGHEARIRLAESKKWFFRKMAAESKDASSKFLEQMLIDEIYGERDEDVIYPIMNNQNFVMSDKARKALADSDNYNLQCIVAEDDETPIELLENMNLRVVDEDVLDEIELNLLRRMDKNSVVLNSVQKRKIYRVLKQLKYSNKKQSIAKCLEEIVKILSK